MLYDRLVIALLMIAHLLRSVRGGSGGGRGEHARVGVVQVVRASPRVRQRVVRALPNRRPSIGIYLTHRPIAGPQ
eukprot:8632260-Pyramimonas_sp.AAC.1